MIFKETGFKLKDGRDAVLRSPCEDDARTMLNFIIRASGETEFLMRYPEEHADLTIEKEKEFIRKDYNSQDGMMIALGSAVRSVFMLR